MKPHWYEIELTKLEKKGVAGTMRFGKFLGYPLCCTEYFIKSHIRWRRIAKELQNKKIKITYTHFSKYLFSERKNQPWDKHFGFIPCPKCSKKIYELGTSTLSLIKNRKCTVPLSDACTANTTQERDTMQEDYIRYREAEKRGLTMEEDYSRYLEAERMWELKTRKRRIFLERQLKKSIEAERVSKLNAPSVLKVSTK